MTLPGGEALSAPEEAPAEEQSAEEPQKPSPATEGSDSGEGGAIAPEEVVPQTEPMTADETEGETTSSDSPDGEPASPEGEAQSAPEEAPVEEQPAEEAPVEEASDDGAPIANALTYTGEAQALVTAGEGWLFSMDGEAFTADIPTAVDAGDYTVFFKAAEDAEAQALTVTVAKADVTLIPPEAMTGEK